MPLLDRLLLREIAIPLGVGLLAILQLLFILQLLQLNEVVFTSAVTVSDLMRLTAALAPHFLVSAVPLAFMLGVQLGLGRLAADQEVLALSAAGTHPLRLYRVPIAIGGGLALVVAALTHWAEPWGLQQLNRVLNDVIKRNLESGLEPGIFNDGLPRFMIYVTSEDPAQDGPYATWHGVLIEDDVGDGAPLLALAEVGRIEESGGEALALRLSRGELPRPRARGADAQCCGGGAGARADRAARPCRSREAGMKRLGLRLLGLGCARGRPEVPILNPRSVGAVADDYTVPAAAFEQQL